MHMRIDDSWQYRSACGLNDFSIVRDFEISRLTNGNDAIPLNSNKTISDGLGTCTINHDPIGYD